MRVVYLISVFMLIWVVTSCLLNRNVHERVSYGPNGVYIWRSRYFGRWNREASQQDARAKSAEFKSKIESYIAANPNLSERKKSNLRTSEVFREMTKTEVLLLLDEPFEIIRDPSGIEKKAQQYWPELKGRVDEAWDYRHYTLFFQGDIVIDIHRDLPALQPL